jgi:hypothetical protein
MVRFSLLRLNICELNLSGELELPQHLLSG